MRTTPSPDGFAIAPRGLRRAASRFWRTLGTAIGFGLTGILSVLLGGVVFPLMRVIPGSQEDKEIRAQGWVHRVVRFLLATFEGLGLMRLRADNGAALRKPGVLVVANHPTLLDAFCLISQMPQADCVVKASRYRNPLLSSVARGAGYVSNADGPRLVEGCVERLIRGRSVIVFPEGTRSPPGGLGELFRGAAHVALKARCNPVPVTIRCDPPALYRGRAWWDVSESRFTIRLRVGDPVSIHEILESPMPTPRAARILTAALKEHFERQLKLD